MCEDRLCIRATGGHPSKLVLPPPGDSFLIDYYLLFIIEFHSEKNMLGTCDMTKALISKSSCSKMFRPRRIFSRGVLCCIVAGTGRGVTLPWLFPAGAFPL